MAGNETIFQVIEGGLSTAPSHLRFQSAWVTDTRLMGVVVMCIHWQGEDPLVQLHQYFYFDCEELGFDRFDYMEGPMSGDIGDLEASFVGGLGGSKKSISQRQAAFLLGKYVAFNRKHDIPLPAPTGRYMWITEDEDSLPPLSSDEQKALMARMCIRTETANSLANYYLMRACGKDMEAVRFLSANKGPAGDEDGGRIAGDPFAGFPAGDEEGGQIAGDPFGGYPAGDEDGGQIAGDPFVGFPAGDEEDGRIAGDPFAGFPAGVFYGNKVRPADTSADTALRAGGGRAPRDSRRPGPAARDAAGVPAGRYICESIIEVEGTYHYIVSSLELVNGKVESCKRTSAMKLTEMEAYLILNHSEFVTVFNFEGNPASFRPGITPLSRRAMVTEEHDGRTFMIYHQNNEHVDKDEYFLYNDLLGLYHIGDNGELIVASPTLESIRRMELDIQFSRVQNMIESQGSFEFNEPVVMQYLESDFPSFLDFMEAIQDE